MFETSLNTKPKEKKVEGTWYIVSPPCEKVGDTSPSPPPNCAYGDRGWKKDLSQGKI